MSAKLHVFSFYLLFFILGMAEAITMTKPGCQKKCGNVSIPYPFGIGSSCSFDRSSEMRCDTTFNPPKLFFTHSIPYQVVADFGVSRLNHLDQTAISTLVKGTLGYLDPEYMLTSQLTEKSDVFSFGVVLAELITGKKSISFERAQGERNLAIYFTASMNEERLLHIVEEGMVNEGNIKQVQEAAALAQRCLSFKGEERPSMRVAASELEALRGFIEKHSSSQRSNDKHTNFTPMPANPYPVSAFSDGASGNSVAEITMTVIVAR
ncbi:hypothetical protein ACHQM5_019062 [Ranunculus cassubicifolius]